MMELDTLFQWTMKLQLTLLQFYTCRVVITNVDQIWFTNVDQIQDQQVSDQAIISV